MDNTITNAYLDLAVYCKKCDMIIKVPDEVVIHVGELHHTAYCKACNGYIKHLSVAGDLDALPFGKYKGQAFLDIARQDKDYIVWLMNNTKSRKIKGSCENALLVGKNEQ